MQGGKQEGGSYQESPIDSSLGGTSTMVVMSLGGEKYAAGVDLVKEIVRMPAVTWVPGAVDPVKGVINLRGSIVPVVDLAGALSLKHADESDSSRIVVVETEAGLVGMLVDSVEEVSEIPLESIEPSMQTLTQSQKSFVQAQTNHGGALIGILDLNRIIEETRSG